LCCYFYVLGLDFCIVIGEFFFNHKKCKYSLFSVATRFTRLSIVLCFVFCMGYKLYL
jgi:hypothetical protein